MKPSFLPKMLFAALLLFTGIVLNAKSAGPSFLSPEWQFTRTVKPWSPEEIPPECRTFRLDRNHMIDLDVPNGARGKVYDECFVYNRFELKEAQLLGFGVGADWWIDVFLNGKKVFSTFPRGNKVTPYAADNHLFLAKGKKGTNLLAIRVRRGIATWKLVIAERKADPAVDPCLPVTITVDPGRKLGTIKPMNAVNNGPIHSVRGYGNMELWKAAKIPFARNHDASFNSSYGGEHTVDVHAIFSDFSKDPNNPASYDFGPTDRYLKSILAGGTQVFYRLGSKIEHSPEKYGTRVPADFKKWAVICEHIIRHYNEGWANGYKMNIQYWEIWNEYDLKKRPEGTTFSPTWQGTDKQFFEFYTVAATHLKKCFPHLKIGGPAISYWKNTESFLQGITAGGTRPPLDFFSWHMYSSDPGLLKQAAVGIRQLLDRYGYNKTESILNEWNYVLGWQGQEFIEGMKAVQNIKGATFAAAYMCAGQDSPVDMLMYYDARPSGWNGIFVRNCALKTYYVFRIWAKLAELGRQIQVDTQGKSGIYAVGASKNGRTVVMIARFFDQNELPGDLPVTFRLEKGDLRGVKLSLLDDSHDLADIPYRMTKKGDLLFPMKADTVVCVEIED